MKTYVINLVTSPDRKKFMADQLDQFAADYEFIEAVDGRKLTADQFETMCDMNQVRAWPDLLTPGMIGCSLSHHKVYQEIVNKSIPYALVLEDDTMLAHELPKVLSSIEKGLQSNAIDRQTPILLYYQSKEQVEFASSSKISLDYCDLYAPVDLWRPITTAAYVITQECARRLVDLVYPIKYSPDSWAVFYRENAIAGIRCVLPLPVQSGFFKSDIGYETHKPINRFVKALERNNIFPVKQLLKMRRRRLAIKLNAYSIVNKPLNWQPKKQLDSI